MMINLKINFILITTFSLYLVFYFNASIDKTTSSNKNFINDDDIKYSDPVYQNNVHKQANEFKTTLKENCNARQFQFNETCLNNLDKFNQHVNSKNECGNCFYYFNKKNNKYEKNKIYYHVFWELNESEKERIRLAKLNLLSYLATQNLCCTKFIFWKLPDFPKSIENDLKLMFSFYIKQGIISIKTFYLREYCDGFLASSVCKSKENLRQNLMVQLSDFIRFVVLEKYGGIYTDGDVIYLKDMRFFWYFSFAYRWSFLAAYNTAILGINKLADSSIRKLYDLSRGEQNSVESLMNFFHPRSISSKMGYFTNDIYTSDFLLCVHSYFFDAAWLCNDGSKPRLAQTPICQFFEFSTNDYVKNKTNFNPENFFHGAFAYHIHYKNEQPIETSYFYSFERYYHEHVPNLIIL